MSWRVRGGLVMYRFKQGELEVFLAHPTSFPNSSKEEEDDEWILPKGGQKSGETLLQAAQREFEEELGILPKAPFLDLGSIEQNNGKMVRCWAFQRDWDESQAFRSEMVEVEWPPKSGIFARVPAFDKACYFPLGEARKKLRNSHRPLLDRLKAVLAMQKSASPPIPD